MASLCIAAASSYGRIQPVATSAEVSPDDFQSKVIFDEIEKQLKEKGAEAVKKVNGVFLFKVKTKDNKEGVWVVDVKNGNGSVKFDATGKGDVTLSLDDENLLKLMTGQLNPQQAFFQGKLKISGNMGLAMKLKELQPPTKAKL